MFKLFEVRGGKLTALPDVSSKRIKSIIFGSIAVLIIVSLSGWLKMSEKELWKIYTLILQQLGLSYELPRKEREKELEARIELEVDKAIRDSAQDGWRANRMKIRKVNRAVKTVLENRNVEVDVHELIELVKVNGEY